MELQLPRWMNLPALGWRSETIRVERSLQRCDVHCKRRSLRLVTSRTVKLREVDSTWIVWCSWCRGKKGGITYLIGLLIVVKSCYIPVLALTAHPSSELSDPVQVFANVPVRSIHDGRWRVRPLGSAYSLTLHFKISGRFMLGWSNYLQILQSLWENYEQKQFSSYQLL